MMSAIQKRARHVRAIDLDSGIPERSAKSAEHYRDECLRLKMELANRREETRQLQHRVRILEGPLQAQMQELEALMEEYRAAVMGASTTAVRVGPSNGHVAAGGVAQLVVGATGSAEGRRLVDLLEQIVHESRRTQVVLQSHVDSKTQLEAKDRLLVKAQSDRESQEVLRDQLLETQRENRRLVSKVRSNEQTSMRQKLDHARRTIKKQEQVVIEYERSHHALHDRTQHLSDQLQAERKQREKHERDAKWLAIELEEAQAQVWKLQQELQQPQLRQQLCGETLGVLGGAQTSLLPEIPSAHQSTDDATGVPGTCNDAPSEVPNQVGGARALRQELLALRDEERSLRRLARRRRSKESSEAAASMGDIDLVEDSVRSTPRTSREAAACASLREAFRDAGQRELSLREELRVAESRIATLEEGLTPDMCRADTRSNDMELAQMEDALEEEVRVAESRTWLLAQVANELAMQADLQQLSTLESEVESQRCVRIAQRREELAELRCASMAAVANDIVGALAVDPGKLRV
jgi:hypothetical protein